MNIDLIEFNKNHGITIDEDGNPTIISKEYDNCSLKEILENENELETLNNNLIAANSEYNNIKSKLKNGIWFSILILLMTSYMLVECLHSSTPIHETLMICGGFAFFTKLLSVSSSGFIFINKKKIKGLIQIIHELETEIPRLEKELSNVKEKAKYATIANVSSENYHQELTFDNIYTQGEERNIVKVLKLTKNR